MPIELFFDGGCYGNPNGIATYGYAIYLDGKQLHAEGGIVGEGAGMTNNVAEYTALLKALEWLNEHHLTGKVTVNGDSALVIKQLTGEFKARSATALSCIPRVRQAAKGKEIEYRWIPREQNTQADALTEQAYRTYRAGKRRM